MFVLSTLNSGMTTIYCDKHKEGHYMDLDELVCSYSCRRGTFFANSFEELTGNKMTLVLLYNVAISLVRIKKHSKKKKNLYESTKLLQRCNFF